MRHRHHHHHHQLSLSRVSACWNSFFFVRFILFIFIQTCPNRLICIHPAEHGNEASKRGFDQVQKAISLSKVQIYRKHLQQVRCRFLVFFHQLASRLIFFYFYSSTFVYLKFLLIWILIMVADFVLEFRFEFLWPVWLFARSLYDSFKYHGVVSIYSSFSQVFHLFRLLLID